MPSWIANDPASKHVRAKLIAADKPDHNIRCYRPHGELYTVLSPSKWKRLREQGKLDSYLDKQRRSGSMND